MSKGKIFISVLGVLIVATIIIFNASKSNEENNETAVIPVTQKISFTDISNWNTYKDIETGLSFKYPVDFKVNRGENMEEPFAYSYDILLPVEKSETSEKVSISMFVIPLEAPETYGTTTDEIVKKLSNSNSDLKEIKTSNGARVFFDTVNGNGAFYVGENVVYHIALEGYNQSFSTKTNTEVWENDYPHYIKLMEGVFATFEVGK